MKSIGLLTTLALVSNAFAQPPSDRMVLEFIEHQNRMHSTKDLDAFLLHIPKEGYVAIDASGDAEHKHVITPKIIRDNTLATWKMFDPSIWGSGLAVRRLVREDEYVEIEFSFTELVPLEGRELLTHGILIQRVKELEGKAMLISTRLVQARSRWLSLAEPSRAPEPAAGSVTNGTSSPPAR